MALMPNKVETVRVAYTLEFKRNLRQLAKKYRRIRSDVQPLINKLIQGKTPGDQIPGVRYEVFKARVRNSDTTRGKSGGYRIIYYRSGNGPTVLVTIYSKSEQSDIAPAEIRRIILEHEAQGSVWEEIPQGDA
jgi:mRNA-degrading endonuclease RelE of RelBE toxin-antitoxin system